MLDLRQRNGARRPTTTPKKFPRRLMLLVANDMIDTATQTRKGYLVFNAPSSVNTTVMLSNSLHSFRLSKISGGATGAAINSSLQFCVSFIHLADASIVDLSQYHHQSTQLSCFQIHYHIQNFLDSSLVDE
jgi:hypothetical protein